MRVVQFLVPAFLLLLLPMSAEGQRAMESGETRGYGEIDGCRIYWPDFGVDVTLVGYIEALGPPFEDQMPDDRFEFTFVLRTTVTFVSSGHNECSSALRVHCRDTVIEIYKDTLQDSDWRYPETFWNGRRLIEAHSQDLLFDLIEPCFSDPWTRVWGSVQYTGGVLFDRVSENGIGETGEFGGLGILPPNGIDPGTGDGTCPLVYFGVYDVAMSVGEEVPVAVTPTTWGRIKLVAR